MVFCSSFIPPPHLSSPSPGSIVPIAGTFIQYSSLQPSHLYVLTRIVHRQLSNKCRFRPSVTHKEPRSTHPQIQGTRQHSISITLRLPNFFLPAASFKGTRSHDAKSHNTPNRASVYSTGTTSRRHPKTKQRVIPYG